MYILSSVSPSPHGPNGKSIPKVDQFSHVPWLCSLEVGTGAGSFAGVAEAVGGVASAVAAASAASAASVASVAGGAAAAAAAGEEEGAAAAADQSGANIVLCFYFRSSCMIIQCLFIARAELGHRIDH